MAKRIQVILLFICLFANKVSAQTYSSVTSDKEIYAFLDWMTKDGKQERNEETVNPKQIDIDMMRWTNANFISKNAASSDSDSIYEADYRYLFSKRKGTDTIFKMADRRFLFKQFKAIKTTKWHKPFINSVLINPKKVKRYVFSSYSVPLFSVDKRYVFVIRAYMCGDLCGHDAYYVYRRIAKNTWEYVTQLHYGEF